MIIYKATNKKTNKCYIGKTTQSLENRKLDHYSSARNGSYFVFHRALRKYTDDDWNWDILFECDDSKLLDKQEKYFIEFYNSIRPYGYNSIPGGLRTPILYGERNPMYGKKHKLTTIQKIVKTLAFWRIEHHGYQIS